MQTKVDKLRARQAMALMFPQHDPNEIKKELGLVEEGGPLASLIKSVVAVNKHRETMGGLPVWHISVSLHRPNALLRRHVRMDPKKHSAFLMQYCTALLEGVGDTTRPDEVSLDINAIHFKRPLNSVEISLVPPAWLRAKDYDLDPKPIPL